MSTYHTCKMHWNSGKPIFCPKDKKGISPPFEWCIGKCPGLCTIFFKSSKLYIFLGDLSFFPFIWSNCALKALTHLRASLWWKTYTGSSVSHRRCYFIYFCYQSFHLFYFRGPISTIFNIFNCYISWLNFINLISTCQEYKLFQGFL